MSQVISDVLKENGLIARRYQKKGKATFIDTNKGRFVLKLDTPNNDIINILRSRHFDHLPNYLDNDYVFYNFIDEINIPKRDKELSFIELLADLHYKTTTYDKINQNEFDHIYNDLDNNINYLMDFYTKKISKIEEKILYSPFDYVLACNINVIFQSLDKAKDDLNNWFNYIKNVKSVRKSVIHNNPKLDNFLKNENDYLISWKKSKIDSPIFDLYKFYYYNKPNDFISLLKKYEEKYPLKKEEKDLLRVMLEIPILPKEKTNYLKCKEMSLEIDRLIKIV